jgi:iron complex outermembrane receptor protein
MSKIPSIGFGRARPIFLTTLLASTALTGVSSAFAADDTGAIETVVVTAQKRSEDLQKVPLSLQVLGTQKLEQLHVTSFADYAQYLPSVAFAANAGGGGLTDPGFANVYMRGVASGGDGNHSASLPSVGIYLDEQPVTTIGGSLDIHVYDIARVEALSGPQGTLYGASSEAGTIRIITNKPDASGFSAAYDAKVSDTEHGGIGGTAEGFVNIPLSDKMAIRIVAWDEHDAGYIDNIAGTDKAGGIINGVRTYPGDDGGLVGPIQITNAPYRHNNYNNVDIYGGRAALEIDLDNNWTITPALMGQDTKSHGSFAYDPTMGDLKTAKFAPESAHDEWYQAALTIQGKLGNLDVTYAGAYMDRHVHSLLDYSDYSYFYDHYNAYYFTDNGGNYINPSQKVIGRDHFTKDSHELRFATPADGRLRFVGGVFYERQTHAIIQDYVIDNLSNYLSVTGWPGTLYLADEQRADTDYAGFGEASYDLFPSLTLSAGLRAYQSVNALKGFFGFGKGFQTTFGYSSGELKCFLPDPIVDRGPCTNLDNTTTETGFTHKLNATWHVTDDAMIYATASNGFRPGGVNRVDLPGGQHAPPYKPDYLTNYEIGWKTSWFDDTLHFNGAVFLDYWHNFQFTFLSANSIPFIANPGDARIKGIESDVLWRATDQLTLNGSLSYTDARLTKPYCDGVCSPGTTLAPKGQQLPVTPYFKGNATARYEFNVGDFGAHVQGSVVYNGSTWNDLRTTERGITGKDPAYTIVNFTTGVAKDNWELELALDNAFDERAQLYRFSECTPTVCGPQTYIIPNRPRTVSVRFGQKF